jgi:hypothetical protein
LKASIVGKVVSKWNLENDEVIKKLSGESKKLRRELNKSEVSSIELEQWIAEDHVWFEDRWMVTSWCDE